MDSFFSRTLNWFAHIVVSFINVLQIRAAKYRLTLYPHIHRSAQIGTEVKFIGRKDSFYIGENTYINEAILATGENSKIKIGSRCAIGYRVSIKAITHDVNNPCYMDGGMYKFIERDIVIGDSCWVGDNSFIREGVVIGNNVIIGANSVVTKSIPSNSVVAGSPAIQIRQNK